jgi:predicted component of type VI protein secretion system
MSDEEFQQLLKTPPAPKACPHCGTAAPAGGTFCDNCGEPLQAATAAPADAQSSSAGAQASAAAPAAAGVDDASKAPTAALGGPSAGPGIEFDLTGPTATSRYTLQGDEATIGRLDAEAGIYPQIDFDGNDIVMEGGQRVHAVSRRHGRIFREGDVLKFEDLGSTNGSTLNGAAVLAKDPQPLKDGDTIILGRTCRIAVHIS